MWMYLTAQGTGRFLVRHSKVIKKLTYSALKKFCDICLQTFLKSKKET